MNRMELFSCLVKELQDQCDNIEFELACLSINPETKEWDGYGIDQEKEYGEEKRSLHEVIGAYTLALACSNWDYCYMNQDILFVFNFCFLKKIASNFVDKLVKNGFLK